MHDALSNHGSSGLILLYFPQENLMDVLFLLDVFNPLRTNGQSVCVDI